MHVRSPHLNSTELEIVRRGRNAATKRPKRVEPEIYQQATSLETLMGYLLLGDRQLAPTAAAATARYYSRGIVKITL